MDTALPVNGVWLSRCKTLIFYSIRTSIHSGIGCEGEKRLGGFMVDSVFHPFAVDQMNVRNTWEVSGLK